MGVNFSTPIVVEPYSLTWFDVEFPDPDPHEVIFRNRACLICGSDLHLFKGLHPFAPLPACCGHEVAADVVEIGSEVSSLQVGDRVYVAGTGASPVPCEQCINCLKNEHMFCIDPHVPVIFEVEGKRVARFPSGFGEYTMGHEANAYKIPDNISYLQAAVTTDMAYVLGVIKRSDAKIGDSAVIIGAGPIGLRTLEAAKLSGIAPLIVSEPVGFRLECAGDLGADFLIDPMSEDAVSKVMKVTDGKGVDFVFDTAGNTSATGQGLEMLRTSRGGEGKVIMMGLYEDPLLTINSSLLMRKAGKIIGEWGIRTNRRKNITDALSLMAKRKLNIERWITHQIPETEVEDAMRMLIEKKDNAIGVEIIH